MLVESLRKNVLERIVHYAFIYIKMTRQVAHMRYHIVNKNSSTQEKYEFGMHLYDREDQITIIIPYESRYAC